MPHEPPYDRPDHVDALRASAGERLGMDVQAITRVGRSARIERAPEVWRVMTEVGTFWLAERDGVIEVFLATPVSRAWHGSPRCRSPGQAVRRFLALHP